MQFKAILLLVVLFCAAVFAHEGSMGTDLSSEGSMESHELHHADGEKEKRCGKKGGGGGKKGGGGGKKGFLSKFKKDVEE